MFTIEIRPRMRLEAIGPPEAVAPWASWMIRGETPVCPGILLLTVVPLVTLVDVVGSKSGSICPLLIGSIR